MVQEGPRAQVPCEGCEDPRVPAAFEGGGELVGRDQSGFGDGQEGKKSWKRWVKDPWVPGRGSHRGAQAGWGAVQGVAQLSSQGDQGESRRRRVGS